VSQATKLEAVGRLGSLLLCLLLSYCGMELVEPGQGDQSGVSMVHSQESPTDVEAQHQACIESSRILLLNRPLDLAG
jgi:hypothetical protein